MARSRRDFSYQPSYEETVDRAERKGSLYDQLFKDVKLFQPRVGVNTIRILPPTWKNARHYGLNVKVHYDIGPDDRRYLCLKQEYSPYKRCPIDQALYELGANASREEKYALRAGDSKVYYVVDRENEKEGVQVWLTSAKNDSEIAAQSTDRRTKSVLNITDVDKGYDVEFTRVGTGKNNTKYQGFKIMRDSSPLHDSDKTADRWLDFVFEHPLPEVLNFYSPKHIEEVYYGASDEDDDDDRPRRRIRDDDDDDDRRSSRGRARPSDDDEDDDDDAPSSRRRSRSQDDDDEDEKPRGSTRSGKDADDEDDAQPRRRRSSERSGRDPDADDDDEDDEKKEEAPARRRRSMAEDLDDEIPSEGRRSGRQRGRSSDDEDDDDKAPSRSRARTSRSRDDDDDDDEKERTQARSNSRRRARDDDDADDDDDEKEKETASSGNQGRRARVREILDRG